MRRLFQTLVGLHANLQHALEAVNGSDEVKKYGREARVIGRKKAIEDWRTTSLKTIGAFNQSDLPKLRAERRESASAALAFIANGGAVRKPARKQDRSEVSYANRETVERLDALEDALVSALQPVGRQMAVANGLALTQNASTRALREKLQQYQSDAANGKEFDYQAWSVDRQVLPVILASRAAAGDDLAGMLAGSAGDVESVLLNRMAPAVISDDEIAELLKSESLISAVSGDDSSLAEAGKWLDFLGRGLDRQAAFEAANPVNVTMPTTRVQISRLTTFPILKTVGITRLLA
jgi:hypothetical protein